MGVPGAPPLRAHRAAASIGVKSPASLKNNEKTDTESRFSKPAGSPAVAASFFSAFFSAFCSSSLEPSSLESSESSSDDSFVDAALGADFSRRIKNRATPDTL